MLDFLPSPVKGVFSLIGFFINTLCLTMPLVFTAVLKFVLPFKGMVVLLDKILIGIATLWSSINGMNCDLFNRIEWQVSGLPQLKKKTGILSSPTTNPGWTSWYCIKFLTVKFPC